MPLMLDRWEPSAEVIAFRSPRIDALGVPHAFGTQYGNDRAIADALNIGDRAWVRVRQVHGHDVHAPHQNPQSLQKRDSPLLSPSCDADAVVLRSAEQLTRIVTADCVPILLATSDGCAVAAVHAGWRGLVSGVIERAVEALGGSGVSFVAAIGPCISAAHFEVGEEVAERFDARFVRRSPDERAHVDLPAAALDVLQRLGALGIDTSERCTYADEDLFFSHRRDVTHRGLETTGRMSTVIALGEPRPSSDGLT